MSESAGTVMCVAMVRGTGRWGAFNESRCQRRATVEREGKSYCGSHDPVKRAARLEKSDAAYRQKRDAENAEHQWKIAAHKLCAGVDTETMERLGSGWVLRQLEVH